MSIFSNISAIVPNFSKLNTAQPNLTGIPNWVQTRGTSPGSHPVVQPLGVTGHLSGTAKPLLNNFPNVLKITSL